MLLRRGRSKHSLGVLAASFVLAVIALFIVTTGADASGGYCDSWYGSYWSNPDLSGHPTFSRCDQAIDFDWEGLSPDVSIPVDQFSVRWVRTYNFAPGTYRFSATMDDGMRVYLNGKIIINEWREGNLRTVEADIALPGGPQKITVEYFEKGGNAVAGFTWQALDSYPMPPYPKPPAQPMPPMHPKPPAQIMPPSGVDYPVAEVKASYLNVRSGPGVEYSVVAVLRQNTQVYLVGRDSGGKWVLIRTDGVEGWVNRYYLHTDFPYTSLPFISSASPGMGGPSHPQPKPPAYEPTAVVNTSSLNVRTGPGVQYRAFAVIHGGTEVVVLGKQANGWVQIRIPGGAVGFVNGSYLTYR